MPNILDSNTFGEKIYNRFPIKYREDDVEHNYALKRFIFTAAEGGFKYIIDDANGILNLIDPSTAPLEVINLLYEQFGVPMFNGIPEEFLRNFLPNLGRALDYRGTLSVIDYVATSISGVKTTTEVEVNEEDNSVDLNVTLDMGKLGIKYFPDYAQFIDIMENFIPFYCYLHVVSNYNYSEDTFNIYVAHCIKVVKKLFPEPPLVFDNPENDFLYYVDEGSNLLVDINGDVFISDFDSLWGDIENQTWRDMLNATWLQPTIRNLED